MEHDKVENAFPERSLSRRRFAKSLGVAALGTAVGAPLMGAAQAKAEGGGASFTAPITITAPYGSGSENNAFELRPRNLLGSPSAVPLLRPVKANTIVAFDITPKGNPGPSEGSGVAHIDVCSADIGEVEAGTFVARVGIYRGIDDFSSSGHVEFGSRSFAGTAPPPPVRLTTHGNGIPQIELRPETEATPGLIFVGGDRSNILLTSGHGNKPTDTRGYTFIPTMTNEEGNAAPLAGHPSVIPGGYGYSVPITYNPTDKKLYAFVPASLGTEGWTAINDPSCTGAELAMTFKKPQTFDVGNGYPIRITSGNEGKYAGLQLDRLNYEGEGFLVIAGSTNNFVTGSAAGSIILVTKANTQTLHLGSGTGATAAIQILGSRATVTGELAHTGAKIGFYGKTPIVQPAEPSTLAEVITALKNLGLVA